MNKSLLLTLINKGDVFKFEYSPIERDRLCLTQNIAKRNERDNDIYYDFIYLKNKWVERGLVTCELEKKYTEIMYGRIAGALKKRRC